MKKIFIISVIVSGLLLMLNSCGDKFLDSFPTDSVVSELAIRNVSEANYAINGVYDRMQNNQYYGGYMQIYGDIRGDDVQGCEDSRTSYYMYRFDHRAISTNAAGLWTTPFVVIRNSTRIIEAMDNVVRDGTEAQRNAIKGHAIALRALAHFDILRTHAYPYKKDQGASPGSPIIDRILGLDEYPVRATVKETYDFIIAELERAIPLMSTTKSNGMLNVYGARALLARVYLYCENNRKAYDIAAALIEELKGNAAYQLYTNANYMASFALTARLGSESLMEIVNSDNDNQSWDGLSWMINWFGYKNMCLSQDFIDLMQLDPADVRNGMYTLRVDANDNKTKGAIEKYPGSNATTASVAHNLPLIRMSEVYLIAAEAGVKLNGSERPKALEYLNTIVKRGNPANNVSDSEFTLDRVLTERRKELVAEGHRYFDLMRNGLPVKRGANGYHMDNAPLEIDWDNHLSVLPLAASLFVLNPDLQQNAGYTKN
jgi:SusD family.